MKIIAVNLPARWERGGKNKTIKNIERGEGGPLTYSKLMFCVLITSSKYFTKDFHVHVPWTDDIKPTWTVKQINLD